MVSDYHCTNTSEVGIHSGYIPFLAFILQILLLPRTQARDFTPPVPGFETEGKNHQKSKRGVSMAPKRTNVVQTLKSSEKLIWNI